MSELATEMSEDVVSGARLVEPIHEGARGTIWRAEAVGDGSTVAVHVLHPTLDEASKRAFLAALSTVDLAIAEKPPPAGILAPRDIDRERGAFATKLCAMGSLDDLPALRWQLNRRLEVVATVAEALEWLHERGLAHGALSPAAILLDEDFAPHLCGVDRVNLLVGTVGDSREPKHFAKYASPEARAGQKVDARSDIFSLGRILHYLLASRHPDEPDEDLPKLEVISMSPAGLVRIIRKCTCKDPALRYQDVDSLLADLVHFGHHERVGLPHPKVEERNITGISASVLPERFDRRAQRLAREQAEREAKALESIAPARDVPRGGRLGLAAVGGVVFLGMLAAAYSVPDFETGANTGMAIGAALMALTLPAGRRRVLLHRAIFALGAAMLVWTLGPAGWLQVIGARGRLAHPSSTTRTAAVRTLLAHGERDFSGQDLSGCDLSRLDLTNVSLANASLRAADLSGADLHRARLEGADLVQAKLEGALLVHTDLSQAEGLLESYCNRRTSLPRNAQCVSGHIELVEQGVPR
jgi:serine/threonine-protein kinase